ncbi:hypothetical protein D3C73_1389010 [compost metagenome]
MGYGGLLSGTGLNELYIDFVAGEDHYGRRRNEAGAAISADHGQAAKNAERLRPASKPESKYRQLYHPSGLGR